LTPYERAQQLALLGVTELAGQKNHPLIQTALWLCGLPPEEPDETPWCSAFVNLCHRIEGYPHTNSAAARSWLRIGQSVDLKHAEPGDVVILKRGSGPQPGPEVTSGAPGHVGFYAGIGAVLDTVLVLGGNQGNKISRVPFPAGQVLGVRRIEP
jgi:uncharacterized protein (TIGR02594 family)